MLGLGILDRFLIHVTIVNSKLPKEHDANKHPKENNRPAQRSHSFGLAADPFGGKLESGSRILLRSPSRAS